MSGLVKPKKYDWKDSNLALFGSDTEKEVKKDAAMTEPAWQGSGEKVGLKVWRIVKFVVTEWPKEDYGKFYCGDSYIILNTYKEGDSDELNYDVHFWIGNESSQDEYGTAAYKTVELDTFLDDKAVQHREVQGHESSLFKSYFKNKLIIMKGGADTGFRHVEPEQYKPRLLHFCGDKKHVLVKEIPLSRSRITSNDVFILDMGLKIYQYNGKSCSYNEKLKAMQFLQELKGERGKAQSEVLDEDDTPESHEFFDALTDDDEDDEDIPIGQEERALFKVSDAAGDMSMTKIKDSSVSIDDFASEDVFVFDTGKTCFVWIGSGTSPGEKQNGLAYAQKHLQTTDHQLASIVVIKEGQHNAAFQAAVAA
jgi:gelsolin